jgi:hypothetical protein
VSCQAAEPEFICYPLYCTKPNQSRNEIGKITHFIFISSFFDHVSWTNSLSGMLQISTFFRHFCWLTKIQTTYKLKRSLECYVICLVTLVLNIFCSHHMLWLSKKLSLPICYIKLYSS